MKKIRQSSNFAGGSRSDWPLGSLTLAHVRTVLVGLLLFAALAMAACSSSSSPAPAPVNGDPAPDPTTGATVETGSVLPLSYGVAKTVSQLLGITFNLIPDFDEITAPGMDSDVLVGPCGGKMSYDRTLVESGAFDGTATLERFCGDGRVLTGQFGVTATFDTNTWTPIAATATFTNLQAVTDGGTEAHMVNGTVGIILAASGFDTTINVVITDNNSVRIFELKNFAVNTSEGVSSDTLTLNGIFIDAGHGSVTVSGTAVIDHSTETPTSGQLVSTATDGSKGRLTFSSSSFTVEIDSGSGYQSVGTCDYDLNCSF